MIGPRFTSLQSYVSRLDDVDFWWPYLVEILSRHNLADAGGQPVAGHNATWPTFLCGEVVVKLFGSASSWRASHDRERAAQALIATDPEITAPRLLGEGQLSDDAGDPWPYLITSLMPGVASWRADLSGDQRRALAAELGREVHRIHALSPSGIVTDADWPALDVAAAAARSSLPQHLVAQIDDYLVRLGPSDRVFVHGDVVANHVYVENGRFAGIIDWGDAMVADRHYELIQIFRDLFECDGAQFRIFLEACAWPVDEDFPRKVLGLALYRQATMLVQHPAGGDVFEPIAERVPLDDIASLDDLAIELFAM